MSEKAITPLEAAERVGAWLREKYDLRMEDVGVWDRADVDRYGWAMADAQVASESVHEWTFEACNAQYDGELQLPGVFMEPYSGWLMCFYEETNDTLTGADFLGGYDLHDN